MQSRTEGKYFGFISVNMTNGGLAMIFKSRISRNGFAAANHAYEGTPQTTGPLLLIAVELLLVLGLGIFFSIFSRIISDRRISSVSLRLSGK